jgi:hypothetical protein
MEQRFSRKLARLERRGAVVEPRVGGIEQSGATQLVVADIWGGLFDEIPAFAYEPVPAPDAAATEYTSTDAESACLTSCASSAVSAAIREIELEEKPQDANIVTLEVALVRSPRLHVSLFAPTPDAVFDSELSGTASGRASFRPILHHRDASKFWPELSVSEPPALLAYADDPVDPCPKSEIRAATHPGGGRATPGIVIRLRMRAQRTKTSRRRRPLRRRVWRPPWRFASYGRRPRRHGHRIRSCAFRPDPEVGDALHPRRLTERFDRNRFLRGGTLAPTCRDPHPRPRRQ